MQEKAEDMRYLLKYAIGWAWIIGLHHGISYIDRLVLLW